MAPKLPEEFDLLDFERLASNPEQLEEWLFEHAGPVLDALRVDRSRAITAADLRAMLAAELQKARSTAEDSWLPMASEVEEAIPGRMSDEELQNVLAGGTRKRRPT